MAEKTVRVDLTSHLLSREENGVVFSIKDGDERFGKLIVSKGGLYWQPKGKQKRHFLDWRQFNDRMRDARKR